MRATVRPSGPAGATFPPGGASSSAGAERHREGQANQDRLAANASALACEWERVFNSELGVEQFKTLAQETRAYLSAVPAQTEATNAQLMDIMMAQEFQDLTGQMIKKVTDVVQGVESQLLQLLLENCPLERREAAQSLGRLNGR